MVKVVDLFCGCGWLSLGFINKWFDVLVWIDNWDKATEIYKKNFDHEVSNMNLSDEKKAIEYISDFSPDMIIWWPPCQDFSSAWKRNEDWWKWNLTVSFAKIVVWSWAKYFVMENVSTITKTKKLEEVKKIFLEHWYSFVDLVIDASNCWVPQSRKRYFLLWEKWWNQLELSSLLNSVINWQSKKQTTIYDYLGNKFWIEHYYRHPRSYNRRWVFSINEPSPTIRWVNRPIPDWYNSHPNDTSKDIKNIRPLTTKERALIQTFPENFILDGTKTNLEQIIGNAVPVKLGEYIAWHFHNYIKSKE